MKKFINIWSTLKGHQLDALFCTVMHEDVKKNYIARVYIIVDMCY